MSFEAINGFHLNIFQQYLVQNICEFYDFNNPLFQELGGSKIGKIYKMFVYKFHQFHLLKREEDEMQGLFKKLEKINNDNKEIQMKALKNAGNKSDEDMIRIENYCERINIYDTLVKIFLKFDGHSEDNQPEIETFIKHNGYVKPDILQITDPEGMDILGRQKQNYGDGDGGGDGQLADSILKFLKT